MTNTLILKKFINFLTERHINYAFLGNVETLPDTITSDVDIVADLNNYTNFISLVHDFSKKENINLIQVLQHEKVAYYFVLSWFDTHGNMNFLHPDICTDYYRHGIKFISKNNLLNSREYARYVSGKSKEFMIPKVSMRFIYYLVKRIGKKDIQQIHFDYILYEWHNDRAACLSCLYKYWRKPECQILERAFDTNSFCLIIDNIQNLAKKLRYERRIFISDTFFECQRKISRFFHPTGLFVVFLGPDGCGKSTVIQSVSKDFIPAFRQVHYQHLRPRIACKKKTDIPVPEPHAQTQRHYIISIVKLFYFLFDYLFGYLFFIRAKLVRSTLVIFDRYYDDILVDPKRYRYGGSLSLAWWVRKFIPKPDLVILLDAPAEILQQRKKEVTFAETARQRQAYLKLVKPMPNGVVIDASKPFNQVTQSVNQTIVAYMEKRVRSHFGH